jgi:hypothetical protein
MVNAFPHRCNHDVDDDVDDDVRLKQAKKK